MIKSLHSKNDDHLIEIYLGSNPGPNFSTSLVILSIASEYAFSVPEKLLIVSRTILVFVANCVTYNHI